MLDEVELPLNNFLKPNSSQDLLGKGDFGTVFKYQEKETGTNYAIKKFFLFDSKNPSNNLIKSLFLRELEILSNINYPTIVHLYKFSLDELTIITEFVPNKTVQSYINRAALDEILLEWDFLHKIFIILGVSFGMEYLHSQNIIYRNLKPENILLNSNFYPKLCGFSLAKTNTSEISQYIGTDLYSVPEIKEGNNYNEKSDVYSFGLTLYSIIYDLKLEKNFSTNNIQFTDDIFTEYFDELILKCCDINPNNRPSFKDISKGILKEIDEMIKVQALNSQSIKELNEFLQFCNRTEDLKEIKNDNFPKIDYLDMIRNIEREIERNIERNIEREKQREIQRNIERNIERNIKRNYDSNLNWACNYHRIERPFNFNKGFNNDIMTTKN